MEEEFTGEEIKLGGNITLGGFKGVEPAKMVVVKKIVGNYIKRVQDRNMGFEGVSVNMKNVHSSEFQIKCKLLLGGKGYHSDVIGYNLFVALDEGLNKVLKETGIM